MLQRSVRVISRQVIIASLTALTAVSSAPAMADTAMEWVQKMSNAMRQQSYQGRFVYLHRNQLESMEITHISDERGIAERLVSLNGEARQVFRNNSELTCIWPESGKALVETSRRNNYSPIFIPEDITRLAKFYDIKLAGEARVANKNTVVVAIRPKDKFRYGLQFWINAEHGLMMKSSLFDSQGREVEQVMFTSLELISEDQKRFVAIEPVIESGFSVDRFESGDGSIALAADQAWQIDGLPGGFWRESDYKRQDPDSDSQVHQMVFTDGLASLSVFIEQKTGSLIQGANSMGAVNAYIRIVDDHSITAIGEVPAVTVQRFAESIVHNN